MGGGGEQLIQVYWQQFIFFLPAVGGRVSNYFFPSLLCQKKHLAQRFSISCTQQILGIHGQLLMGIIGGVPTFG